MNANVEAAPVRLASTAVDGDVMDLVCLPDLDRIVYSFGDGALAITSPSLGAPVRTLRVHAGPITSIDAFEKRLDRICSVAVDGGLAISSLESGSIVSKWSASCGSLRAVAFSSPTTVVTGGISKRVALWDIRSPSSCDPVMTAACDSELTSLCALVDENMVVGGCLDGTLSVWDCKSLSRVCGD